MEWAGWGIQAIPEHCAAAVSHPLVFGGAGDSLLQSRAVWLHIAAGECVLMYFWYRAH